MAGRWPGDGWVVALWLPLAISKDCGCTFRSLQDGWGMTWWLASMSSKDIVGNCRSPRDGWEMAGWLALEISNDFGCNSESVGDGWENTCCIRTPNTTKTISATQNHTVHIKPKPDGWAIGSGYFKHIECESKSPGDGWKMFGKRPWLCPKMAGVIRNRCKMVGILLGGWHQRIPNISVEIVDRQEMAGRWLRGWPLQFPKMSGAIFGSLGDGL